MADHNHGIQLILNDRSTAIDTSCHRARQKWLKSDIARVDVLIVARDRADTIERAVLSALAQDEVRAAIVVDDGSTDDTAARARRCDPEGKRLIVERLPSSVGPSAARNIAIEISTAPWLAILDADDFFLPGRIAALLSQSDDCDFLADHLTRVSEDRVGSEPQTPVPLAASIKPARLSFEQFVLGNVTRTRLSPERAGLSEAFDPPRFSGSAWVAI